MSFTLISCGILYERFAPGGLADFNTGNVSGANGEGDYLMNVRTMRAQIPHDSSQRPAMICMTAMDDVAKFIVAALDLPQWPTELRVCGQRMNVSDVVRVAERLRGMIEKPLSSAKLIKTQIFNSNEQITRMVPLNLNCTWKVPPRFHTLELGSKPLWQQGKGHSILLTTTSTEWSISHRHPLQNGWNSHGQMNLHSHYKLGRWRTRGCRDFWRSFHTSTHSGSSTSFLSSFYLQQRCFFRTDRGLTVHPFMTRVYPNPCCAMS